MKPWKRLARQTLVHDRWLALHADRCELPGGRAIEPYYVLEEKDWVHVAAFDASNRVLIVRQYRYAAEIFCSELPGGAVDPGEDPLDAAKRELREETGYEASSWTRLPTFYPNPARQTNRLHLFVARDLIKVGEQSLDETEEMTVEFLNHDAVMRRMREGDFLQSMHVASYLLATGDRGRV